MKKYIVVKKGIIIIFYEIISVWAYIKTQLQINNVHLCIIIYCNIFLGHKKKNFWFTKSWF
jgi:hypothetical protein